MNSKTNKTEQVRVLVPLRLVVQVPVETSAVAATDAIVVDDEGNPRLPDGYDEEALAAEVKEAIKGHPIVRECLDKIVSTSTWITEAHKDDGVRVFVSRYADELPDVELT